MKNRFFIVSLFFLLCTSFIYKGNPGVNVVGVWEETWGVGQESDVTYHDRYVVKYKKNQFSMSCVGRKNYIFEHIHLTGNNFTFRLTNPSDPNDPYIIAYNMEVNAEGTFMTGTAVTNKDVEANIELRRVK